MDRPGSRRRTFAGPAPWQRRLRSRWKYPQSASVRTASPPGRIADGTGPGTERPSEASRLCPEFCRPRRRHHGRAAGGARGQAGEPAWKPWSCEAADGAEIQDRSHCCDASATPSKKPGAAREAAIISSTATELFGAALASELGGSHCTLVRLLGASGELVGVLCLGGSRTALAKKTNRFCRPSRGTPRSPWKMPACSPAWIRPTGTGSRSSTPSAISSWPTTKPATSCG